MKKIVFATFLFSSSLYAQAPSWMTARDIEKLKFKCPPSVTSDQCFDDSSDARKLKFQRMPSFEEFKASADKNRAHKIVYTVVQTPHTHLAVLAKSLKSDAELYVVSDEILKSVKKDLIELYSEFEVSPAIRAQHFENVKNLSIAIQSMGREQLSLGLVQSADLFKATGQNSYAEKMNSLLSELAPGSSRLISESLNIRSNSFAIGQKPVSGWDMSSQFSIKTGFSIRSHLSGTRLSTQSEVSVDASQKFTTQDRIVSAFSVSFGSTIAGASAGAKIGGLVGAPATPAGMGAGALGGALLGGGVGFLGGFATGYYYPMDVFAKGTSFKTVKSQEIMEDGSIRITTSVTSVNHATGGEKTSEQIENIGLPEIDSTDVTSDNDAGCQSSGTCPGSDVSCEAEEDFQSESVYREMTEEERESFLNSILNPLINFLDETYSNGRVRTGSMLLEKLVSAATDSKINWGENGKPVRVQLLEGPRFVPNPGFIDPGPEMFRRSLK